MPQTPIPLMTTAEIRQVTADSVVLGFPLVLTDMVRRMHPLGGNTIRLLPARAGLLAPGLNDDDPRTLATSAWLDVSQGAVMIDWPPDEARQLCVVLYDAWGERILLPAPPRPSARIAVVGADWIGAHEGADHVWRLPGSTGWMITRAMPKTPAEQEAARDLLLGQSIETAWPARDVVAVETPPRSVVEAVLALDPPRFLHRLAVLLARNPPPDPQISEKLARLGVALGSSDPEPSRDIATDDAIGLGFRDAASDIADAALKRLSNTQGWRAQHAPPEDELALTRAAFAATSLGAPAREDVISYICDSDSEGRPLRGSVQYLLAFGADDAPPADDGWSLALHSPHNSRDLSAEPRSLDRDENVRTGPDGVVEILIQHAAPGMETANWLPTPSAEFTLLLRLYRPTKAVLEGFWSPPQLTPLPRTHASSQEGHSSSLGASS